MDAWGRCLNRSYGIMAALHVTIGLQRKSMKLSRPVKSGRPALVARSASPVNGLFGKLAVITPACSPFYTPPVATACASLLAVRWLRHGLVVRMVRTSSGCAAMKRNSSGRSGFWL